MDRILEILLAAVECIMRCLIVIAAGHCMMTAVLHIISKMYM